MQKILLGKFPKLEADVICGNTEPLKPGICNFINSYKAIQLLNKALLGNGYIGVHCDVDMDGIGSAFIINKFFTWIGYLYKVGFVINSEKEHGIKQRHIDYFNNTKNTSLIIILDSSCNEIETIKKFNGDVIIIDHHVVQHKELSGKTAGGEYVIVTNMVDNYDTSLASVLPVSFRSEVFPFKSDEKMSCGLVLYEWLRVYQLVNKLGDLIERGMLYQWAGITLFTDVIQLDTLRNQYYITQTVHNVNLEPTIKVLVQILNKYNMSLDKTFINFSLAPRVNKAIRAGQSRQALDIILNRPQDIKQLDVYKENQDRALENLTDGVIVGLAPADKYILKQIDGITINKSYCGVIASKLVDQLHKNTIVGVLDSSTGIYSGSFRGRFKDVDYRKYFVDVYPDIYAQGHSQAFGFKGTFEQLNRLMNGLDSIEPDDSNTKYYLTAEYIPDIYNKGEYHIDSLEQFRRDGGLMRLGIANSKLSSDESINIMIFNIGNFGFEQKGKVYIYDIYGIKCKAFEPLNTEWLSIYVEYSKTIEIYIRNVI